MTADVAPPVTAPPLRIGLIGAGWRAQYFLRIARALPDRFAITRVLVRSEESANTVRAGWGDPAALTATTNFDDFVRGAGFDYVIVCVPASASPDLIRRLAALDIPVLAETPPAYALDDLVSLWADVGSAPVQVVEQYRFQPHHAARIAVTRCGLIGHVTSTHVSSAHGYHGVSLIRACLGVGFAPVEISAFGYPDRVVATRGRGGWAPGEEIVASPTTLAVMRFEHTTGVFEFSPEQYFSPLRGRQVTIRGTRGEIRGDRVDWLVEAGDAVTGPTSTGHAVTGELRRDVTGVDGDLDGSHLRGVWLGERMLFVNRFAPARLSDDEIAVAETMHLMGEFMLTGEGFSSLADASHDRYLAILIERAVTSGAPVFSERQGWEGGGG